MANWRIVECHEPVSHLGGVICRFNRWRLVDDEPDFQTTLEDCQISGCEIHALADAFMPDIETDTLPDAEATEAAPVVNVPARLPTIKKDGFVLKRAAAIAKYSATWRTIKTDFKHASENDLSEAAKATKHGYWYENALLAWADQRGKRIEPVQSHTAVNSVFNLPGKKHTLKG